MGATQGPTRIVVDGEQFDVSERADRPGQYDFDWVSGPNQGYGFSSASSNGEPQSLPQLERQARAFLAQVDPETGYID